MAAEIRRRLIDHARRRLAEKRGGGEIHAPLSSSAVVAAPDSGEPAEAILERLDRALTQLRQDFPRAAHVVELRFFVRLTTEETAVQLRVSSGTVKREWTFARAWLAAALASDLSDR
jgi:RNA polymerase sigma factor (TIGR02999 family)